MAFPDCKITPVLSGQAGDVCQQKRETERRERERRKKVERGEGTTGKRNGKMEAGQSKL